MFPLIASTLSPLFATDHYASCGRHQPFSDETPTVTPTRSLKVRSRLAQDLIDGPRPRLPARRETEPVARFATRPAQPRLHPGLDFLIRGTRVLPAHPLPVHPHPGIAQAA